MNEDILDRLKRWASVQADGSQIGADLREAVAEIEHLRAMAGAVTGGPDFAEIRTSAVGRYCDDKINAALPQEPVT